MLQFSCHHIGSKPKPLTERPSSNSTEFIPPQPLSPEEVKLISEQCDQRFIKLQVSRILDNQVSYVYHPMD